MRSRWTNFRVEDGEKEWRKRDAEFEASFASNEELKKDWEAVWEIVAEELSQISEKNMKDVVFIRNDGHTILEAFFRQSNHLAYHTGQILHQAKLIKKESFSSLSIPKGASKDFNKNKFSTEKGKRLSLIHISEPTRPY